MKAIEQAIRDMPNLGANPSNDGNVIRVSLPELTEERRREFVKIVKARAEDARVAIRNVRRSGKDDLDVLKSEVGEDEVARAEKELESVTKQFIDQVDDALKRKEAELLEV
jgi:ribosome recycling factor